MKLTAQKLAEALGVALPESLDPQLPLHGVTTDSRHVVPGQLFVGLKGKNYDGADFAAEALAKGAALAVIHKPIPQLGVRQLVVPDTLQALGQLAQFWRQQMPAFVIAVTGSAGKTTTKDLIASICAQIGPTLATLATENNEIGVPKTLLQLNEQHRFCVLEFGMRARGEIKQLTQIAQPHVGVITIIGEAHMGLLGTREAIAEAKAEILPLLPPEGTAVLNADDFFFPLFGGLCSCRIISFGFSAQADVRCVRIIEEELQHLRAEIQLGPRGEIVEICVPLPGRHNLLNALAAAAAGLACGADTEQIRTGIENYAGAAMRGKILAGPRNSTIIDDSYNANPTSMAASLQLLAYAPGRKIFVMGDMLELGSYAQEAHRHIGRLAAEAGVSLLISVGDLAEFAAQEAAARGIETYRVQTPEEAAEMLLTKLLPGDTILVKGSRAMALDKTVRRLLDVS